MDLEVDGIYRAFDFMKTDLVISKTTFPLLTSNLMHLIALEVQTILEFCSLESCYLINKPLCLSLSYFAGEDYFTG